MRTAENIQGDSHVYEPTLLTAVVPYLDDEINVFIRKMAAKRS